jgi:hypothetical protein
MERVFGGLLLHILFSHHQKIHTSLFFCLLNIEHQKTILLIHPYPLTGKEQLNNNIK